MGPITLTHLYIWWRHQWLSSSSWWGTEDWERASQQGADRASLLFSLPLPSPWHDCWSREWLGLLHGLCLSCAFWMSSCGALLLRCPLGCPPQWPTGKDRAMFFMRQIKSSIFFSKHMWSSATKTSDLQPLFLSQRITVVNFLALSRASAKHFLLLLFAGQSFHLGIIFQDPAGHVILLHQTGFSFRVAGFFTASVQIHALKEIRSRFWKFFCQNFFYLELGKWTRQTMNCSNSSSLLAIIWLTVSSSGTSSSSCWQAMQPKSTRNCFTMSRLYNEISADHL